MDGAPYFGGRLSQRHRGGLGGLSVLGSVLVLSFITINAGMAVYRSLGDVGGIMFVASAYLSIVALFVCVALFVQAPPRPGLSPGRSKLKAAVWLITTSLTFQFVYEVMGPTKPTLNVAILLWTMPAVTGVAVFYVFLHEDR